MCVCVCVCVRVCEGDERGECLSEVKEVEYASLKEKNEAKRRVCVCLWRMNDVSRCEGGEIEACVYVKRGGTGRVGG